MIDAQPDRWLRRINLTGDYVWRSNAKLGAEKFRPLVPYYRLNVLCDPFSETTPFSPDPQRDWPFSSAPFRARSAPASQFVGAVDQEQL